MVFHIAIKDLKVLAKDRKALLMLLLMPALIMLILGTALSSAFGGDAAVSKFTVGVVDKDKGSESAIFIDVLKKYYTDLFEVVEDSEDEAVKKLQSNKSSAVIVIPEGYTRSILSGKNTEVEIKTKNDDQIKGQIVSGSVEGYMNNLSVSIKGYSAFLDMFKVPSGEEGDKSPEFIVTGLMQSLSGDVVKFVEATKEKTRPISAIQYYSVAMLVMFLLFSAVTGISMMIEERDNNTLGRIIGAGVSKSRLMIGKCMGLMLIGCIQMLILIIFTRFAYGVNWGGPVYGIAVVSFCAVFASSGFGMFVAAVGKTMKAANGMGTMAVQVFTILGGGMVPIYVLPSFLRTLSNVTPNWQAMDGYYKLMQGVPFSEVIPNCLVLLLMGAVFLTIGITKFRTV
ncbi:MAG TPA: ABC transporter permease [Pseudobacteroides sp.]|uniref:ABC transporter permease n=1 Tax=Pseudobacteroides sp. TaxID=1968840 RepID=UPI002F937C1F